jgi:hypothetical protein
LADLPAGELLGEVALLDGKERSADATALTKCELVVLERRDVVAFLEKRPDVCLKLLELMCARLRKSDQRMSDIAFLELSVRLAKVLLDRSSPSGRAGAKSKLSLSQTELASMIHATRENVNRCLRDWQRQGIVDLDERWIVILQREAGYCGIFVRHRPNRFLRPLPMFRWTWSQDLRVPIEANCSLPSTAQKRGKSNILESGEGWSGRGPEPRRAIGHANKW